MEALKDTEIQRLKDERVQLKYKENELGQIRSNYSQLKSEMTKFKNEKNLLKQKDDQISKVQSELNEAYVKNQL